MPRLMITMHGASARAGGTWAVTSQWAVASGPANSPAFNTVLGTVMNSLSGSAAFKAGVAANYPVQGLHGLYYPVPGGTASIVGDSPTQTVTGTQGVTIPPLAVVVSERTNAAGPSYRGRSYWPNGNAGSDGIVTGATQTAVRSSWLAFHSLALAALAGAGYSPIHVVWSKKTGNMTPITYIQTGDRIDTARGRFGDALESYASSTVPTSLAVTPAEAGHPDADPDDPDVNALLNSNGFGTASNAGGPLVGLIGDALTAIALNA